MTRDEANKILADHANANDQPRAYWSIHHDTQADARDQYRDEWTVHYAYEGSPDFVSCINATSLEQAVADVLEKCKPVAAVARELAGVA